MDLTIDQAIAKGVTAHKAGRLLEAERFYQAILQLQPSHPDANHNLGVLAVSLNKTDRALPLLKTALEANPKVEQFWVSYISALIKASHFDKARKALNRARKRGVIGEKLRILEAQITRLPKKKSSNGEPPYAQVDDLLAHYKAGQLEEALKLARILTSGYPTSQIPWKVQGALLRILGQLDGALDANQKAVQLKPDDAEAHYNLANVLKEMERLEDAKESYRDAITNKPCFAEAHYNLGNVLLAQDEVAQAEHHYEKAITLKPNFAEAFSNLGSAYSELGKIKEAKDCLEKAIGLNPKVAEAHRQLTGFKTFTSKDEQFEAMQKLYCSKAISDEDRCHLNFGLAKAFEDLGDLRRSFDHYKKGNAIRKKILNYSFQDDIEIFEKIRKGFNAIRDLSPKFDVVDSSPTPIFIIGMPRSGTTLTEQIISSHPQVEGAGELRFAGLLGDGLAQGEFGFNDDLILEFRKNYLAQLKSVSAGQKFVTDKMPQNFLYLGLLTAAIPEAKIVHVKRSSAAVCWANFKQYFSAKGLGYSYDLDDVKGYYELYSNLMNFWRSSLSETIYELDYELLTENQDTEIRKLIHNVGLDWDDKCLSPQNNKRLVLTASNKQVRQKIYSGSSLAWKKFEPYLEGKFDHL